MPLPDYLTAENRTLADKHLAYRDLQKERPTAIHRWWRKCRIEVLVVADGFLSFDDVDFGLSDFVDVLHAPFSSYATIDVRRAHRGTPTPAQLNGAGGSFEFSDDTLAGVDVVFLFAAQTRLAPALPAAELDAIKRFMDAGGGLFATGDHEDVGVAACGEIPRVRAMRRWCYPEAQADASCQPLAPHGSDSTRHTGFSFGDPSGDVPQRIQPTWYGSGIFERRPHPLLCGPNGVIDVLPDPLHEGECIAPADLAAQPQGEFPELGGHREVPEVIATSTMIPAAETSGGRFGAISAYDGHRVDVGRVATDATWHHFINRNLTGTSSRSGHPKELGFLASATGQAHLENIKAYFRNLAMWLAPRRVQRCIAFRKLLSNLVIQSTLAEVIVSRRLETATARDLITIGVAVRDIFKVNTDICEELALEALWPAFLEFSWRQLIPRPWPLPDPARFDIDADLAHGALGGLALRLRESALLHSGREYSPGLEKELMAQAERGAAIAASRVAEDLQCQLAEATLHVEVLRKACPVPSR